MSNPDPFQELVDSLRKVLLRSPTTMPSTPPPDAPPTPSTSSTTVPSSPMARQAPYSGGAEECNGFLLQCSLIFTMQPALYPTDQSQIAFITSLLTNDSFHPGIYRSFQGAAASGWNERSLLTTYRLGLEPKLRLQLAALDDNMGLERFIQQSLRCSDRMKSCQSNKETVSTALLRPSEPVNPSEPEPMIIESDKLTSAERQRRLTRGLCMYCGASGHVRLNCPLRPVRTSVSGIHSDIENMHPLTTNVQLTTPSSVAVTALIDSGSAGNFISGNLCRQLQLRTEALSRIYQIQPITGDITSRTRIHRKCESILLQIGLLHKEDIQFLVLEGATVDIILGHPWLVKHDPIISWGFGEILKWGEGCTTGCFPELPQPIQRPLPVYTTSIESPIEKQSVQIPDIHTSYKDVFCPKRASQLPPHRPWDCAIDLILDAPMPRGKIYPLSLPETKAMEEYIQEALSQGYIRPSTSPAASSFFFVVKKDGGLRPCIDYRTLNQGTIKFRYPLPLVPAALEQLRSARIFTKLDLRSAYNLVRIHDILIYSRSEAEHRHHIAEVLKFREHQLYLKAEKCSFHLSSVKFLGYCIDHQGVRMDERKDYSIITTPLTNLLSGKPRNLSWTPEAAEAFHSLKSAFTQAPLLTHPDPDLPFVVEVDASTTGVGAVFSQYHGTPKLLHSCAYYSRKLSPAERNYDIDNRELLAIKLALEEWRHWLEGAIHPFQVITDHKNLQYLRDAKRLCPRQARWSLFFSRFNFSITYRPGSKNIRADALSRLHDHPETSENPANIIPEHIIVNPIEWSAPPIVATPAPRPLPGCPPDRQFVPQTQRVDLIHSMHTSLGTGHPGVNNTLSLLSDRFWWPSMARDVRRYVQGCKECAISKSPRHLPAGKLHPLPVPNRPWSHLGVDFMTDLPSSDGNTCILVIIDRFSKFCRLLPLKGLPTALETAEILFNHVFRYYGIPENIVSDRGPQFISRVWKAFFKLLGVTDSWNQFLGWAEYAQNSLRQPATGLTPFQCVLGFQPPLFPWNGEPSEVPTVDYWFRESKRVWDAAHHHLQRAVRISKIVADRRRILGHVYTPGQKVWLSTRDIRLRLPSRKLSPRFVGPFTILEQVNPVTYKLQLPPQYRIHPTFHISLLKPFHQPLIPSTEPGHEEEPPPPLMLEEGSIYSVREILQSRRRGGQLEYLVDWEGYGPEERSWVPRVDILDPALMEEFHANHPEMPAPWGRGRPPRRLRSRPSGAGPGEGGNVTDWPGSTTTHTQRSQSPEY
ncbi:Transposon Tf2-6 polyprotein [Labeo rohita]|uniref:Gypsy retrotransposon integrase-like protein 1 n=1 Tax=Labeo rohita TaxID=84645 RepID=A0ABQ8LSY7_LABRO|nr:Transposon Tf2-6 polyprotein [Labeo rohita]